MLNLLIVGKGVSCVFSLVGPGTLVSSSSTSSTSLKASGCMSLDNERSSCVCSVVWPISEKKMCGLCVFETGFPSAHMRISVFVLSSDSDSSARGVD